MSAKCSEKQLAYFKKYREEHRDKVNAYYKKWRADPNNAEKLENYYRTAQAKRKAASNSRRKEKANARAKVCHGCTVEKKTSEFNFTNHVRKDGTRSLRSHCNECRAAGSRKWYSENKEQAKATKKVYESNNAEKVTARQLRYRERTRDEARVRSRVWYKENPERGKANAKVAGHKRRAMIAKVGGGFTAADIRNLYATQGAKCYYCSVSIEKEYHIDHMTPIIRGGSNDVSNLCLTDPECNLRKHTKTAEEFIGGR